MSEVYGLDPGATFAGRYRVEHVLGRGGMGCVFAAVDLTTNQRVAIKFLWPNVTSEETRRRFQREARLALKLRSPHVVRVLDAGLVDDVGPYMVMEHLDGANLKELCAGRRLPVDEAVGFLRQAVDAVAEAHALGIVHRDLKPANLFVVRGATSAPIIKVLDFGVSKAADSVALTKEDTTLGSPPYMPPEQFSSSNEVDARADIWSLGVILYELLTGISPFEAETLPRVCFRVLDEDPPPPSSIASEIPPAIDDVVLRCLRKDRDERFPSCAAFVEALTPFASPDSAFGTASALLRALPPPASPSLAGVSRTENVPPASSSERAPRVRRRGVYAGVALVALVAAGTGGVATKLRRTPAKAAAATVEANPTVTAPAIDVPAAAAAPSLSIQPSSVATAGPLAASADPSRPAVAARTGGSASSAAAVPSSAGAVAPKRKPGAGPKKSPDAADGDLGRRF